MTIPVQLELLKRRGKRPFNALPPPRESQIQISLIARLKLQCRPGIMYYHTPNGELREDRDGAKLRAMGVLPGVADLEFVFRAPHPNLYLELKSQRGRLTDNQKLFRDRMLALGHFYETANSIDEAVSILQRHGVLP